MTATTSWTTPQQGLHRSRARAVTVSSRFSVEEHEELRARAVAEGMPLQDYIYMRVLDRPRPAPRRPGPATKQQEALPVPAP